MAKTYVANVPTVSNRRLVRHEKNSNEQKDERILHSTTSVGEEVESEAVGWDLFKAEILALIEDLKLYLE